MVMWQQRPRIRDGRDPGIDLLRGLAIVLVVIHHTMLRIPLTKTDAAAIFPTRVLDALGYNGYEAVFIFFVISGYLITEHAMRRSGDLASIDLQAFYARRLARIAPCLGALILLLSLFDLWQVPNFTITREGQSLAAAISSALGLYLNWYEGQTGYLPAGWDVLWSLSIEEMFYLAFPLVCLIGRLRARLLPTLLPALLPTLLLVLALSLPLTRSVLASNPIWREKAYLPGMAAIATGVLASSFAFGRARPDSRLIRLVGSYGLVGVFCILFLEDYLWRVLGNGTMLILTSSSAALIQAFRWGWLRKWCGRGTAWIRSFGRLSYEIYLSHVFVLFAVLGVFHVLGSEMDYGWVWFFPSVLLSWALGWLIDRYLSSPANRWLLAHLDRNPAAPPSAASALVAHEN